MAFPKGKPNPNAGRPPGIPNKVTTKAREAIANFIDLNAPMIQGWVEEVYRDEGAKEALKSYIDLLEFAVPKLMRTEHSGVDGAAIKTQTEVVGNIIGKLSQSARDELRAAITKS